DAGTYPSLIWELSREHGIPFTFAGGIPVTYTRPGQAALAFLDWIGQGFAADALRRGLAAGSLTLSRSDGGADRVSAAAARRGLREAGGGWGRGRHGPCPPRPLP